MNYKQEIIKILRKNLKDRADFVFLFGSVLNENFKSNSDIDIALFLKKEPKDFKERIKIISEISGYFDRKVDVIILNDGDLIISMQVITNGELIINDSPRKFIEYKTKIISQYIDFKKSRKIIEDNLMKGRIYA